MACDQLESAGEPTVMKSVVTVLPAAHKYLEDLAAAEQQNTLRVSLNNKGCGGKSYHYEWIQPDQIHQGDEVLKLDNVSLVVRADAIIYLLGSSLDLVSDGWNSELTWHNPQVQSMCGCGRSVSFS
jgi:iron-sulfur cluster assembly accessory protein